MEGEKANVLCVVMSVRECGSCVVEVFSSSRASSVRRHIHRFDSVEKTYYIHIHALAIGVCLCLTFFIMYTSLPAGRLRH